MRPYVEPEGRVLVGHEADVTGGAQSPAVEPDREVEERRRLAAREKQDHAGDQDEDPDEEHPTWLAGRRPVMSPSGSVLAGAVRLLTTDVPCIEHRVLTVSGSGPVRKLLAVNRQRAGAVDSEGRAGRTNSAIKASNLAGSSTNGSWPDSSNQTSLFEGAVSRSIYATLVSAGTQ